ncbi:restriction endonuclease subunit S [Pseudomonas chlororaphis]|uniref:restriction endonuclease subunit S n=1 Tax=Pseudomonas chlororaphis TaxID=587753 RepID=UPI00240827D0|nr:restriction endonuclease subunit S [Pseudomonas chlororaphis]
MSFPAYPAYKDSGVEWLGDVPEHWTLHKLKHIARFSGGGTPSRDNLIYWNGNIPWISPKDMKVEIVICAEESITAEGLQNSTTSLVPPGAVLIVVRSGILKHTIPAAINKVEVALNQDMKALRFDPKLANGEFFLRWVQGFNDQLLHVWLKQGATVESIEQEYLSDTTIPMPDFSEQRMIVDFLDHETARIDALIEEQQRLIELLKEKRQAVISHAVTKGLDAMVPMKDSGVEWLGEVPAHWSFKQSKYLLEFVTSGSRGWAEYYSDDGDLFFRIANLTRDSIEPKLLSMQYVTPPENAEGERSKVRCDDILISITADLGSVCVANNEVAGSYVSQHVALARPIKKTVFSRWLAYFVLSDTCKEQLVGAGYGGTKVQLSLDDIRSFWVSMPPYDEQVSLAAFLDREIQAFDGLITQAAIGMDLLSERRSALISAAVTGKIDVRGWQPPASATSPELAQEAV